jgi:hypothetical protein
MKFYSDLYEKKLIEPPQISQDLYNLELIQSEPSENTIISYWKKYQIPFKRIKGLKPVRAEVESLILKIRQENVKKGMRCFFETLIMEKYVAIYGKISRLDVEKTFNKFDLFKHKKSNQKKCFNVDTKSTLLT